MVAVVVVMGDGGGGVAKAHGEVLSVSAFAWVRLRGGDCAFAWHLLGIKDASDWNEHVPVAPAANGCDGVTAK